MKGLFNESVEKIQNFYKEHDYELGWRFLNCSKKVLDNDPQVAFITLNPGGNEIPKDHPWASCENGSSYIIESWKYCPPGTENLQKQIRLMFRKLAKHLHFPNSKDELLKNSLSGYFIPFRSARYADLQHKKETLSFSYNLWSELLNKITPRIIICIDKEAYKRLQTLIPEAYNILPIKCHKLATGWGNYQADIDIFGDKEQVKLLRLPHLSTFKLFTRTECDPYLEEIFKLLCL